MAKVFSLVPSAFLLLQSSPAAEDRTSADEFFEMRVRPVLARACFACHTDTQLGDLRVDSREALLKGGKRGPAVVPGQSKQSLLIRAVTHVDETIKMPMGGGS